MVGATVLSAGGCAHRHRPPPPRLTLRRQLELYNSRAARLAKMRAIGSVTLSYTDRYGNPQVYQAQGTLLLDRAGLAGAGKAALRGRGNVNNKPRTLSPRRVRSMFTYAGNRENMLLVGRYVGRDVFELGMNAEHYWIIERPPKDAVVGSFAAGQPGPDAFPLYPLRLLYLLGVTPLHAGVRQALRMRVMRRPQRNVLEVWRRNAAERLWLTREIFINRRTDLPARVRLFDQRGRVIAQALLRKYRVVSPPGQKLPIGPEFPFHVIIESPVRQSRLSLNMRTATLGLPVDPRIAFRLPDMQGLRVQRVGGR